MNSFVYFKTAACSVLSALLVLSCERLESLEERSDEETEDNGLYATALSYPKGYNWRKDSLDGRIDTDILLFRNGRELMKVPVKQPEVPDPEMHRYIKGHLYINTCNESQTIIRKDSLEIFRYDGRECIDDIAVRDSCIFTLSHPRKGEGWSFRCNGKVLISGENGSSTECFHYDGGKLYFAYWQPLTQNGNAIVKRYFLVEEGKARQLSPEPDIEEICAIRHYGGKLHYLATSPAYPGIIWQCGDKARLLDIEGGRDCRDLSFVMVGNELLAHAQIAHTTPGGTYIWNDYYWKDDSAVFKTAGTDQVCAFCDGATSFACVCSPMGNSTPLTLYLNGQSLRLPDSYRLFSGKALCRGKKNWGLGVNDTQDDFKPLIITGIDTMYLNFNGYVTRLYLP